MIKLDFLARFVKKWQEFEKKCIISNVSHQIAAFFLFRHFWRSWRPQMWIQTVRKAPIDGKGSHRWGRAPPVGKGSHRWEKVPPVGKEPTGGKGPHRWERVPPVGKGSTGGNCPTGGLFLLSFQKETAIIKPGRNTSQTWATGIILLNSYRTIDRFIFYLTFLAMSARLFISYGILYFVFFDRNQ